jgi:hypothetical protein
MLDAVAEQAWAATARPDANCVDPAFRRYS